MTNKFKEFLASILILSDNQFDRSDLVSLGRTLEEAEKMPRKSVPSRVSGTEETVNIREVEAG